MIENLTENPHLNNVIEQDVIVIFNSPIQHYVTPKLYTETKPTTGKVVPTWNYAAVQVYGRARIFHDTKTDEAGRFLSKKILDLSRHAKNKVMGFTGGDNPIDWKVSDAPDKFIELLKKSIIGIEIEITSMGGKFMMSQEMGMGDRQGVINGVFQAGIGDCKGDVQDGAGPKRSEGSKEGECLIKRYHDRLEPGL